MGVIDIDKRVLQVRLFSYTTGSSCLQVRVFSYAVGPTADPISGPRAIACSNKGTRYCNSLQYSTTSMCIRVRPSLSVVPCDAMIGEVFTLQDISTRFLPWVQSDRLYR